MFLIELKEFVDERAGSAANNKKVNEMIDWNQMKCAEFEEINYEWTRQRAARCLL